MKIKFYANQLTEQLEFLIYERLPDGKMRVILPLDSFQAKVVEAHEEIQATFKLPRFDAEEVLKDLAEQLDQKGIKTSRDAKIEGTLEAMKLHLEDMRRLVFK